MERWWMRGSSHVPLTQLVRLSLLKSPPPSALRLLSSLWGLCKALVPFLPTAQICSWFTAGKSHAPTQLQFNKGQISLPATLPFPLPSLSLLSLQLKFNTTQQFLVPQHVSTPSIFMTCTTWLSSFLPSLNIFFYSVLFFCHCILGKHSNSFCMTSIGNRLVPAIPFLKPSS